MAEALTTKALIKDRLGMTVTTYDALLDKLINAVVARINLMTGRVFTTATFTNELHDGSDALGSLRSTLIVKNAPITTLTSVQYDAGANGSPQWTDFPAADYRADLPLGIIHFPYGLPRGMQNVRVTYVGGYASNAYPEDVVEVVEEVVVRIFKRRESEGKSSESFQESSITWTENVFSSENLATIKNYRRGYNI
ncbi:hypothetical protein E3V39_12490 [Gammaproteobacteria bacterium LSUCC0112]|nr:hypothetical protein E3V39_12490 [Gammaproteobacteria bacterium LSUCC0112]